MIHKLKRRHRTLEETVEAASRLAQQNQVDLAVFRNRLDGEHFFCCADICSQALEPEVDDWRLVAEVHPDGTTTFVAATIKSARDHA